MAKQTSPRTSSTPKRKAKSEAPGPITEVIAKPAATPPAATPAAASAAAPAVTAAKAPPTAREPLDVLETGGLPASTAVLPPSHDQIAARAFELYQTRGASDGGELSDWLKAERELRV